MKSRSPVARDGLKTPPRKRSSRPPLEFTERAATLHLFAESIRTGDPCEISGESNLWSFGAVMAGVESARSGLPVDVCKLIGWPQRLLIHGDAS